MTALPLALLAQLPIPPPGPGAIEGNVPLAAAYLKLFARRQGLEELYRIEVLPPALANTLGDQALIEAILSQGPAIVGFSCYVWNVERTLWIAEWLKRRQPELIVLVGGPEVTPDNTLVTGHRAIDCAIFGEGERQFAELLARLAGAIASPERHGPHPNPLPKGEGTTSAHPNPLSKGEGTVAPIELDAVSSPYVEGVVNLDGQGRMLLETVRGCPFRCKYCYYPKSHEGLRFLSNAQILANLRHGIEHGASEVVLLDPTLNGRPDFAGFLRLLGDGNSGGRLALSGELRAEGIDASSARLLREAGFREVEIGLQSVEPRTAELMGRPTNAAEFERGAKAILAEGIKVQVDLIIGLPGDTVDSVRRGIEFLHKTQAYSQVQAFNLSILPGTAFRQEAERLGLRYQPWPPYYVLQTPTLDLDDIYGLMEEVQEAFGVEFDALPPPKLERFDERCVCRIDLDGDEGDGGRAARTVSRTSSDSAALPPSPSLVFTLWFRSSDFDRHRLRAADHIRRLLRENPHTTLQVVLEPAGDPEQVTVETLELLLETCYETTSYLDRYYSLHPGQLLGSKRLIVALPRHTESRASESWRREVAQYAALAFVDNGR
jgi:radical SAM superfamily enzyme YgiQ (UPF0313 family)